MRKLHSSVMFFSLKGKGISLGRVLAAMLLCLTPLVYSAPKMNYKLHPEQKRVISIGNTPEIQLSKGNVPQFEIVVGEKASPTAVFAGAELCELLGKCFGASLKTVKLASGKVPAIIIGDAEYAKKAGLDLGKLDRDGFYIRTFEGNIILVGNDDPSRKPTYGGRDAGEHATLFAVYDFLERFAGVRFYFPGELGTVTPKLVDWTVPRIDISERPDYPERFFYTICAPADKYKDVFRPAEYGKRHHKEQLRARNETWNWVCCHGLAKLCYPQRFAKEHPEYFAETLDGKATLGTRRDMAFCYSRGFKEEVIKDAISFFKGESADVRGVRSYRAPEKIGWPHELDMRVPCFDITPDDSYLSCKCPVCRKIYLKEDGTDDPKKLSDFMWQFYADVANAVKNAGFNGYVTAWSYNPTTMVPSIKLPDNILMVVCARGPWNYKNKKAWDAELKRIADFGKISNGNLRLWSYMNKYPWGLLLDVPTVAPKATTEYYKAVGKYICGVFDEAEVERMAYQYLNNYVFYKLMWNIDTDVDALLEEHYKILFGNAAGEISEIYSIFEDKWLSLTGNFVDTISGPQVVVPSDHDIWSKFYSAEVVEKVNGLFKAAEGKVAPDSLELRRIRHVQREMWQPTVDARSRWTTSSDTTKSWNGYAVEGTPSSIDGRMDDPEWKNAPEFWLVAPTDTLNFKHQNDVKGIVKVLYDKDNYYIGFDCDEPMTERLIAQDEKAGSNPYWGNSTLQVFLNTQNDRNGIYQVAIDKNGVVASLKWKNGARLPWKNNVKALNYIEPGKKWQAEFVLPRAEMEGDSESFPVNFMRYRSILGDKPQVYYWYPFTGTSPQAPDKWGCIHLKPESNPSLIRFGDFEVDAHGRLGAWWGEAIQRDTRVYLTAGGSILLEAGHSRIAQMIKIMPDTEYEFSFFAKMENLGMNKKGGLAAKINESPQKAFSFPPWGSLFRGSHQWHLYKFRFRTDNDENIWKKPVTSVSFAVYPKDVDGKVWIDHVELREVK